ncbi:hypothetical protein F4604DRAFT_1686898 [Suillus subluteus]|nr:hypothetical protein F4604DRAFT_1686898 [Suillus subluteus]
MSTLVAQPDKNLYSIPFPPKHSYRHHETRSNSTQATTHKATQFIKPASPGLPSGPGTEQDVISNKLSLLGKEEASENKPVIQPEVSASSDASPLHDVCQQSFVSDRTTCNVRKVLNYLSKPTLHMSHMAMLNLSRRLAYDYNMHVLIVNMPTVLHQVSFNDVKIFVSDFIHDLPYDPKIICPMLDTSLMLEIADGSVMPDMAITVTAVEGPTEVVLIPFVAECALSETDEHVFEKAEDIILAYPDVICIAVVLVHEAREYAAPDYRDSTVPTALCGGTDSDPKPLTLKQFINLRTMPRSFGDHTWCHLSSVEYFVWVKRDDGSPIDIHSQDPGDMAYGIVMPEIDMDAVMEMLE